MRSADAVVTETLLEELLTPDRLAVVLERLLARSAAERDAPNTTRVDVARQLAEVETALDRLTAAVAAGGDVPALVEAIKAQDARRRTCGSRILNSLESTVGSAKAASFGDIGRPEAGWSECAPAAHGVSRPVADLLALQTVAPDSRGHLGPDARPRWSPIIGLLSR